MIFQDALRLQKMIFRNVLSSQHSSDTIQQYRKHSRFFLIISDLLGFIEIPRAWEMIEDFKDLLRFQDVDVPFSNHR